MTRHFEILVEEPSMEAFLRALLPRLLPRECSFEIHPFQGKADLLAKVEARLKGYVNWLPQDWRVIVLVDRDNEDCRELKSRLEQAADNAGMPSRSSSGSPQWRVLNRVVIEELEAWYFGDWNATIAAYPRVPKTMPFRRKYRDPDRIAGGTCEALERILFRSGYFRSGIRKIEVARAIGAYFDAARCNSRSFQCFWSALCEAIKEPHTGT